MFIIIKQINISLRITLIYPQEWLFMILENLHDDLDEARIRNMALSQMLMDIESSKLRTPFNERPSCRAFAELVDWLKTVLNQQASLNKGEDEVF